MKLYIKDIVQDTYTNAAGFVLLTVLKSHLTDGQSIILSFKDSAPTSSSFLNSSIGELLDDYGFNTFKKMIKFVDLSSTQSQVLKNYFQASTYKS